MNRLLENTLKAVRQSEEQIIQAIRSVQKSGWTVDLSPYDVDADPIKKICSISGAVVVAGSGFNSDLAVENYDASDGNRC